MTTITANIGYADVVLPLSGELPAPVRRVQIDSEEIDLFGPAGGTSPLVVRGVNGTSRAPHSSGATVTPLYGVVQPTAPTGPAGRIDFSTASPGTETDGSLITSRSTWVAFTTAGACGGKLLLENQSATGEFATWRMRARANMATASGDGGNSIGTTTCLDASASAQKNDYGVLKAINAVAQPNAYNQTTDATNIVTALYGRIDATGTSVGRRWVTWIDTHATTKAAASDYLVRLSHNGTVAIDGAITIYGGGRLPVLFNFEDATPGFLDLGAKTITFKATDGNHTISFT